MKFIPAILLSIGLLGLPSCGRVLPAMVELGAASQLAGDSLELLALAGERWAERNPALLEQAQLVRGAVDRARLALRALQRLGASASAYERGDASQAKLELLAAYSALYQLASELGLIQQAAPVLKSNGRTTVLQTAPSSGLAPAPAPLRRVDTISPDELRELLRTP